MRVMRRGAPLCLIGVLAASLMACGVSTPEPASGIRFGTLTTGYRTRAGAWVACNTATLPDGRSTTRTTYTLRFSANAHPGSSETAPDSFTLALRGTASSQYDSFYTRTVQAEQLARPGGSFLAVLSADATSALYLSRPGSSPVMTLGNPGARVPVSTVKVSGLPVGGIYAQVTADSGPAATSAETVPVYERCTVQARR